MRVEYHEDEFVVTQCTFEERVIPQRAGFDWRPERRRWITQDPGRAFLIPPQYLAASAKRALGLEVENLFCPDGLEYLAFQDDGIRFALGRRNSLIGDQPGLGKGHPISTRLLTPTGWKRLGDLEIHDQIIGSDGQPTRISGIFDRGLLPVYRVSFSDGASLICDSEHLWPVWNSAGEEEVLETRVLLARMFQGETYSVPLLTLPAYQQPKAHDVPPQTAAIELVSTLAFAPKLRPSYTDIFQVEPTLYASGSYAQRMDFLSTVVRMAGRVVGEDNHIQIDLVASPPGLALADTICELVRSMGGLCLIHKRFRRRRLALYIPHALHRTVLGLDRPTKFPRRRLRRFESGVPERTITEIIPCGRDQVRCISVTAKDQLYVADHYIVTHNTVQAIGFANSLPGLRQGLIIPPASLKDNWVREFKKWDAHGRSIDIAYGDVLPTTHTGRRPTFTVINYDILERHEEALRSEVWDAGIIDESHALKNRDAKRTKAVLGGRRRVKGGRGRVRYETVTPLPIRRTLFLTGTPLSRNPIDLFTTAQACDPVGLGADYEKFAYRYNGAWTDGYGNLQMGEAQNLDELNERLRGSFMIRRLKSEVLKQLPPKTRQIVPLPAEGLKRKMAAERSAVVNLLEAYEQIVGIGARSLSEDELIDAVLKVSPKTWEKYAEHCDADAKVDLPLTRLAQARQELAVAKLPMITEFVDNLLDAGEKVVVFAYHQAVIEGLMEMFPGAPCIYGKTPMKRRQDEVDRFQNYSGPVPFIGQFTAAGTGYTLTEARHVVCAELTWVPHELLQAEDRIHRIGQEHPCWAHHLVVQGSLDDTFVMKLLARMEMIESALD